MSGNASRKTVPLLIVAGCLLAVMAASWVWFGSPMADAPPSQVRTRAAAGEPLPEDTGKPLRVLLIGNSYARGIEPELRRLFVDDPEHKLELTAFTPGGRRLIDHLHTKQVVDTLQSQPWDIVVLQEQSQTPSAAWLNFVTSERVDWHDDHTDDAVAWFDEQVATTPVALSNRSFAHIHIEHWAGAVGLAELAVEAGVPRVIMLDTWPRHPDEYKGSDPFLGLFNQVGATDGRSASLMMAQANVRAAMAWQARVGPEAEVSPVGAPVFTTTALPRNAVPLYSRDHSHLNTAGYRLAALTLYNDLLETARADRDVEDVTAVQHRSIPSDTK